MVGHAGSPICIAYAGMTLTRSKVKTLTFAISTNCTFLRLSPPPVWRGAQNRWLIIIVWDLVYSYSEPDF